MEQKHPHSQDRIQILTTLNENYLPRLQVLLTSMHVTQPEDKADIWLIHSGLSDEDLSRIRCQCRLFGFGFYPVMADSSAFTNAPVSTQYPREMYYRLLAAQFLPDHLHRILYLDPDILVINSLRPLWETDLKGNLFAAAAHTGKTELANNINQLRLGTNHNYYNSGVLLIDLERARKEIHAEELFSYVKEHAKELLLPDQDVLNAMYGRRILEIDDSIWNYDARNYNNYLLRSAGVCDMDWVMENTAVLHFCGRAKPWQKGYIHRFGVLYKHYMALTAKAVQAAAETDGNRSTLST